MRKVTLAAVSILIVTFIIVTLNFLNQTPHKNFTGAFEAKAAIVDHLSIFQPNRTFIEEAEKLLKEAGYEVDYFAGEEINVEFYRNLPLGGYSLIILRVHSTAQSSANVSLNWVVLFSSEPYSENKYWYEQITGRLVPVRFVGEEFRYFGITPLFVEKSMKGNFKNATIIMMGCEGLKYNSMAEAFVKKGAKVYISWDGPVLASHTDSATTELLKQLVVNGYTVSTAIAKVRKHPGPDPVYKSKLIFYPIFAAPYILPQTKAQS